MRHLGFLPCVATIIKPQVVSNYVKRRLSGMGDDSITAQLFPVE